MAFCPQCGSEVQENARFCPRCGQVLSPTPSPGVTPPPQPTSSPPPPSPFPGSGTTGQPRTRPDGVLVLAILAGIGGLALLGSAAIFAIFFAVPFGVTGVPFAFTGLFAVLEGVFVVLGILYFILAYGYWVGYPWAWWVGLILSIIGLLGFPIGTIISAIILYYLTRPHVKAWFRQT